MKNFPKSRGFVLYEALMAVSLAMALVVGIVQLLTMVSQERRVSRQYSAAVREAGNLMEEVMSRSWAETEADQLASLDLSEGCRQCLPEAGLEINAEEESDGVRRITIRIDWPRAGGQRGRPVCLVGWQFRHEEDGR